MLFRSERYWFWRLDYYLWENREKLFDNKHLFRFTDNKVLKIVSSYIFRTNRSIEHFQPQDQSKNHEWASKEAIDSFGNLAMISPGFNSQQSNDPIHLKVARIENQAINCSLQSIKLFHNIYITL